VWVLFVPEALYKANIIILLDPFICSSQQIIISVVTNNKQEKGDFV